MNDLVPGANLPLPDGTLVIRVPGPFDLSVLVTGEDGKVSGDGDFVFYNQPTAPGARLQGDTVTVDVRRLRPGAHRLTVVASPAEAGTPLGRLPLPTLTVTGGGGVLARFVPPRPAHESVLLLAEIYRRGAGWKLRALGQGYADGLAGIARDFGIEVAEDAEGAEETEGAAGADGFAVLVNAQRSRAGTPPATVDRRLTAAAQAHAAGMAAQRRLGADGPGGISVFQQVTASGYRYLTVAQHLVSGPRTPAEFVEYLLGSEERRRPLLDAAFTETGAAHAVDSRSGNLYWTALWARPFTADGLARVAAEVVALTNRERAGAGLPPLAEDARLAAAAQAHSTDMIARSFYAHTSPDGGQPWDRARAAGCAHRGIGENIACGQRSPAEVVRGWMDSPGHRANILKPSFTHIGIGLAGGGQAGTYWTQLFGSP